MAQLPRPPPSSPDRIPLTSSTAIMRKTIASLRLSVEQSKTVVSDGRQALVDADELLKKIGFAKL